MPNEVLGGDIGTQIKRRFSQIIYFVFCITGRENKKTAVICALSASSALISGAAITYSASNILFSTTVAEISRLAASGMTRLCGLSITSSVTIMLRRTGRQCIK